jgi:hypothetical protein
LALHTNVRGKPNPKQVIPFERSPICLLAQKLQQINLSAQPGLIPQISGKLTHQRVNGAMVFVDHSSDHVYAYLMRDHTLDEMIAAKHGYERYLSLLGMKSKGSHADNG